MKTEIWCWRTRKSAPRARRLTEIADPSADQDGWRTLQLGHVEGEGNLSGKSGFDGVPIGGNYIDRVGAGEDGHVLSTSSLIRRCCLIVLESY
jgi:hypothetical protein